ncbi:hypothetical protein [Trebonia sp.]
MSRVVVIGATGHIGRAAPRPHQRAREVLGYAPRYTALGALCEALA